MDTEKSSNSSFEDLSNLNETELNDAKKDEVPKEDEVVDILGNGQLTKKIIKVGSSELKPMRGDICKISLVGKLENGTVVEKLEKYTVQVGDVEVVQGVDMAIALMSIGEIAEITVESRFAYGTIGLKNENTELAPIPSCAKIIYTVEIIEFKEESDLESRTFEQKKQVGNKKRERGNFWYERNEYNLAIQLYRRALEYLDESSGGITDPTADGKLAPTNAQLQELLEDRIIVYNNLAAAQMKISAYDTALTSIENVLRCQPNNVKALFRKGKILDGNGNTNAAIPIFQKAAMLDPESKAVQQELSKLILKQRREARNEKDLYKKMLGRAEKMEEKNKKSDGSNKTMKKLAYFMGSVLVCVVGVAMYRYKF